MELKRFIYATIDNRLEIPDLAKYPAGGINAAPLEVVCYRDIAAVVSAIDIDRFAPDLPLEVLTEQQQESYRAYLLKYQQVNSFLFGKTGDHGMLPLKFGFTASSNEEVEKVLEQAYIQLRTCLDRLQGTMELVIQASWELPKILQDIVKNNPDLAGTDALQTGKLLFEAAEVKKRKLVAAIHDKLSLLSKDYLDAPLKTEAMIFNRSYLVEKKQEPLFDDAVDAVATEFEDYLNFRYIGPLPVYSFVNIELNQGNFSMVDKSRKLLQLPEQASWETIKSAYRQLLLANHPDRNPDDPKAPQRTKEIVEAYEIISAYCHSLPGFGESLTLNEYSFAREAVEQSFIVDNKGAVLARAGKSESAL
jgi:DnaJ-domain-containing protein 1